MAWEDYNRDAREHTLALGRAISQVLASLTYICLYKYFSLFSKFCYYFLPCSFRTLYSV